MPSGAFAHRLFSAGFSTGITTSSYFPAASNMGCEALRHDLAGKFVRMGAGRLGGLRFFSTGPTSSFFLAALNRGWEARRPYLVGKFARMGIGRLGGLINTEILEQKKPTS